MAGIREVIVTLYAEICRQYINNKMSSMVTGHMKGH